jgi:hypothetical protein
MMPSNRLTSRSRRQVERGATLLYPARTRSSSSVFPV